MEILRTQTIQAVTTAKSAADSKATAPEQRQPVADNGKAEPPREAPEREAAESRERLEAATNQINESLAMSLRSVRLGVHEGSGTPVIQVIDDETGDVIRQLPSERVLKLANWRSENGLVGSPLDVNVLLDEKA